MQLKNSKLVLRMFWSNKWQWKIWISSSHIACISHAFKSKVSSKTQHFRIEICHLRPSLLARTNSYKVLLPKMAATLTTLLRAQVACTKPNKPAVRMMAATVWRKVKTRWILLRWGMDPWRRREDASKIELHHPKIKNHEKSNC